VQYNFAFYPCTPCIQCLCKKVCNLYLYTLYTLSVQHNFAIYPCTLCIHSLCNTILQFIPVHPVYTVSATQFCNLSLYTLYTLSVQYNFAIHPCTPCIHCLCNTILQFIPVHPVYTVSAMHLLKEHIYGSELLGCCPGRRVDTTAISPEFVKKNYPNLQRQRFLNSSLLNSKRVRFFETVRHNNELLHELHLK